MAAAAALLPQLGPNLLHAAGRRRGLAAHAHASASQWPAQVQQQLHRRRRCCQQQRGVGGARRVQAAVFDKLRGMFSAQQQQQQQQLTEAGDDDDGNTMVQLDEALGSSSEEAFGPLAVLLVGFLQPEFEAFRSMMLDMEADMVKLVPCTQAMLAGTLQQALESGFPAYEQPRLGQRRAVFLSGMYGSEVAEVIAAYRDAGLPPTVWAAAVPNSWERVVSELVDAVWKDASAMQQLQQQQQQSRRQPAPEDSY